jgi:hypothetical protein
MPTALHLACKVTVRLAVSVTILAVKTTCLGASWHTMRIRSS